MPEIKIEYVIEERYLIDWRPPEGMVYGWRYWSALDDAAADFHPGELQEVVNELARAFTTEFRIVRRKTTTEVLSEVVLSAETTDEGD